MSNGAIAATAAAAAIAQAVQAMGAIVQVDPEVFLQLLRKTDSPLVVGAKGGFFSGGYKYLTSVKGLFFYAKSPSVLPLGSAELIWAKKVWIPHQW